MTKLKRIGMWVAGILTIVIATPLIAALFVSTRIEVDQSIVIDRPVDEVFAFLKKLKNHEQFSTWAKLDPQMKITDRGTDGEVGFVTVWESENPNVGKSEQELKRIEEGRRIDIELRFKEPFESTDPAYFTTEAVDKNHTRVTSGYRGKVPYPMNLLCWMIHGQINDGIATSLANLKELLEKK